MGVAEELQFLVQGVERKFDEGVGNRRIFNGVQRGTPGAGRKEPYLGRGGLLL